MRHANTAFGLPNAIATARHGPLAAIFGDLLAPADPSVGDTPASDGHWVPRADVRETDSSYRVELELPAVDPAAVRIEVRDDVLRVSGERAASDESGQVRYRERRHGKFARSFRLPKDADPAAITATGKNGVVDITVGKHAQAQPRTISVEAA